MMRRLYAVLFVAGCAVVGSLNGPTPAYSMNLASAQTAEQTDLSLMKWNAYISVLNVDAGVLSRMSEAYLATYGSDTVPAVPTSGPTMAFWLDNDPQRFDGFEDLIEDALAMSLMEPRAAFDQQAEQSLRATIDLLRALQLRAQDLANNPDPNAGPGASAHQSLIAAYTAYREVMTPYMTAMTVRQAELAQAEIASMRKAGMSVRPLIREVIDRAMDLRGVLQADEIRATSVSTLNIGAYKAAYEALDERITALEGMSKNTHLSREEGLPTRGVDAFVRAAVSAREAANALLTRYPKDFSDADASGRGTPENLARRLDAMIGVYNDRLAPDIRPSR